jgi:hypothetical protein
MHPGVRLCGYNDDALIHHTPVAKRAYKGTSLGGTNEAGETYSPLKTVLEAIDAACANHKFAHKLLFKTLLRLEPLLLQTRQKPSSQA